MCPSTHGWQKRFRVIAVNQWFPGYPVFLSLCVCAKQISANPPTVVQAAEPFVVHLHKNTSLLPNNRDGRSRHVAGAKVVEYWWTRADEEGLPSSSLPPQFTVSTRLHFLPPVSRKRAVTETTREPLPSKKKKKKHLSEISSNIPHRSECSFWQPGAVLKYTHRGATTRPAELK